ncbi:hypothetical protein BLA29_011229 [Euroglyphus maynei]|uniref:Uncharacterized protein n=1 Tax=Euroglyphus maynei TaxID=6958 RepID=A0A1Y3B5C5_EURMA|nr:hypothetical protein BLA29_011229 [Euroglyphus maynei]
MFKVYVYDQLSQFIYTAHNDKVEIQVFNFFDDKNQIADCVIAGKSLQFEMTRHSAEFFLALLISCLKVCVYPFVVLEKC